MLKQLVVAVRLFLFSWSILLFSCTENNESHTNINSPVSCVSGTKTYEVRGTSMFGIFVAGQNITLLQDYYNCHPVSIGDIIVFNYKGNLGDKDWIKQVYAKAGDTIELLKESGKTYILVNGKKIYNYQNKAYQVDSVGASYIHLAQKTQMQNNIIPRGYYLVLGTALIGGWDSRRVGLIPHNTILGKVKDISN